MNPMIFAIAALVLLVIACVLDRWSKHAGDVVVLTAYTVLAFGFAVLWWR